MDKYTIVLQTDKEQIKIEVTEEVVGTIKEAIKRAYGGEALPLIFFYDNDGDEWIVPAMRFNYARILKGSKIGLVYTPPPPGDDEEEGGQKMETYK